MEHNLQDVDSRVVRRKPHSVLTPVRLHPTAKQILSAVSRCADGVANEELVQEIIDAEPWEISYHLNELSHERFILVLESGAYKLTDKGRRYLAEQPEVD